MCSYGRIAVRPDFASPVAARLTASLVAVAAFARGPEAAIDAKPKDVCGGERANLSRYCAGVRTCTTDVGVGLGATPINPGQGSREHRPVWNTRRMIRGCASWSEGV
jgi:hypothetical protein